MTCIHVPILPSCLRRTSEREEEELIPSDTHTHTHTQTHTPAFCCVEHRLFRLFLFVPKLVLEKREQRVN